MNNRKSAKALGWLSIGLGLTEMLAPRKIEKFLGTGKGEHAGIFRALGAREIMQGVDLLTHNNKAPGMWARVAGDALDTVMLGLAMKRTQKPKNFAAFSAVIAAIGAWDMATAVGLEREAKNGTNGMS